MVTGDYPFFTINGPTVTHLVSPNSEGRYEYHGVTYDTLSDLHAYMRQAYAVKVRTVVSEHVKKSTVIGLDYVLDIFGEGDETGKGVGYIFKDGEGFHIQYETRESELTEIVFEDSGVYCKQHKRGAYDDALRDIHHRIRLRRREPVLL